jgi:hypothetical protein
VSVERQRATEPLIFGGGPWYHLLCVRWLYLIVIAVLADQGGLGKSV